MAKLKTKRHFKINTEDLDEETKQAVGKLNIDSAEDLEEDPLPLTLVEEPELAEGDMLLQLPIQGEVDAAHVSAACRSRSGSRPLGNDPS